jgi:hypothetical protein
VGREYKLLFAAMFRMEQGFETVEPLFNEMLGAKSLMCHHIREFRYFIGFEGRFSLLLFLL